MTAGPCHFCKAANAPFGYRPPGQRSRLPGDLRGKYIRTCADCRPKGEARIAERFGAMPTPAPPPGATTPKSTPPAQGSLI